MRICAVARCDKPAHQDLAVCLGCTRDLERHLGDVPALAAELDVTISRQTAGGSNGGSRSSTRPLAFDVRASEAAGRLRNTLSTWVRDLATDEQPQGPAHPRCACPSCAWIRRGTWPADTLPAMAVWLLGHLEILRTHRAVAEIMRDIDGAVHAAWRAVDRRPDLAYAGICSAPLGEDDDAGECPEHLYAKPEAAVIVCRACGAGYDLADRRSVLLAALGDQLMTAFEIARAAAHLGVLDKPERGEKLIAAWVMRSRIQARGVNHRGKPTYNFGEVRELLEASTPRRPAVVDGSPSEAPSQAVV